MAGVKSLIEPALNWRPHPGVLPAKSRSVLTSARVYLPVRTCAQKRREVTGN